MIYVIIDSDRDLGSISETVPFELIPVRHLEFELLIEQKGDLSERDRQDGTHHTGTACRLCAIFYLTRT